MSPDYAKQREALADLSVAYMSARDFTRRVLCTAFGDAALRSVPPPSECVWPPDITQAEADSRLRAVRHFLSQAKNVFKDLLCKIEAAQVRLVASGFDVPRSWIIIDPLDTIKGGYLGVCGVEEIVRSAASEDSALETVVKEISQDLRKVKGEIAKPDEANSTATAKKPKRSTARGDGRAKLIPALTKHHDYANGSCLNMEPIGNNELAHLAHVAESTASEFFKAVFGGYGKYRAACLDRDRQWMIVTQLKAVNGEFSVFHSLDGDLSGEDGRDGDK